MVKPLDIAGARFGMLVALKRLDNNKYGRAQWWCRCDCGTEKSVSLNNLRKTNGTSSCGCLRTANLPKTKLDLEGKRSGKLLVVRETGRTKDQSVVWECLCDCGNTVQVVSNLLKTKQVRSCGCFHHPKKAKSPLYKGVEELSGSQWASIRSGAVKRNLSFDLTIEQAWEKFESQGRQCALSGVALWFSSSNYVNDGNASLDRIDSSQGYYYNNIQWVHKELNRIKLNVPNRDFIDWCKLVANHNRSEDVSKRHHS